MERWFFELFIREAGIKSPFSLKFNYAFVKIFLGHLLKEKVDVRRNDKMDVERGDNLLISFYPRKGLD